jgi:transcriptional regulator with XRE-family HTH domain
MTLDFLDRLEKMYKEKNIKNRKQLSEQSGIPYTTIDNLYRSGFANMQLSTLIKLASFFDCSLDYLIFGEDKKITRPLLNEHVISKIEENDNLKETVELLSMLDPIMIDSVRQIAKEIVAKRDR